MSTDTLFWPTEGRTVVVLREDSRRKDWSRKLNEISRVVDTADAAALAPLVIQTRRTFADAVQADKAELLGNPLCWDAEEREIAHWIAEAFATLARAATRVSERLASLPVTDDIDRALGETIVAALVSRGDAQKWHAIAGSTPASTSLARIHGLFRLAERRGIARAAVDVAHEGVRHGMTAESLYLRVLLFGFLFAGHLSRQRVEILDAWLWAWVHEYRLTAEPEAGALGLWVDLQAEGGAHSAFVAPAGLDVRFLVISHLEDQLEEVIGGFHAGLIFPGFGISCAFRIEEHVAVVDYLQKLVQRLKRSGGAPRSARRSLAMPRVEAFVGVGEIVRKGFCEPSKDSDRPRRWLRIRDVSDTGLRLVAQERDWESIEVGDLLGFREPASGALVLGEVVRKLPDAEPQCVQLGVAVLSREPTLMRLSGQGGKSRPVDVLYLPGNDSCGREDSLLASDTDLAGFGVRELEAAGYLHSVQPNRARRHGRGWATAGFEVLEVKRKI